jgi:hypothetical protein
MILNTSHLEKKIPVHLDNEQKSNLDDIRENILIKQQELL